MSLHTRIVSHLRTETAKDGNTLGKHLIGFTDDQVFHKLFHSFRDKDNPKGLRLTWLGLQLLTSYFKKYDIDMPDGYVLGYRDLLYLDGRAKMPYYIGRGENDDGSTILVVFDTKLGLMLKMADGMISNLRDLES